ncbi:MAG: hypothetical protein ACTSRC_05710 [Candidatus Helarchaeota archaeon]
MHKKEKSKDVLDLTDYIDTITMDVYNDYIKVHFLTPYQLKIKGKIILRNLPLFDNVYSPRATHWDKRVQEELEIFEFLEEKYVQQVGFPVYDQLSQVSGNNRIWHVNFRLGKNARSKRIEIRLDLTYPYRFPRAKRDSKDRHVSFSEKCFGEIGKRWRSDGRFGIPHFLVLLSYYYALEHTSVKI